MAQQRQSGTERYGIRNNNHDFLSTTSTTPDQISLGIRIPQKQGLRTRRFGGRSSDKNNWKNSVAAIALVLSLIVFFSLSAFYYLSKDKELNRLDAHGGNGQDIELKEDSDFLENVTRTTPKVLNFGHSGHGSVGHGRDSRYWDRDDRRRGEEYNVDVANDDESGNKKVDKDTIRKRLLRKQVSDSRGVGWYNEAGRNELKLYEAEYEASLKNVGQLAQEHNYKHKLSEDADGVLNETGDSDDEYDDAIDFHDDRMADYDDMRNENENDVGKGRGTGTGDSSARFDTGNKETNDKDRDSFDDTFTNTSEEESSQSANSKTDASHRTVHKGRSTKRLRLDARRTPKRRSSCEMKFLNSTAQLVEPLESKKFSRFSLQYTEVEERPSGEKHWEPRFAGHQSLQEREDSYHARDQKLNCGFVRGPKGSPSTGFDIVEDDTKFMSSCHIAVSSCIFGNSDNLRTPTGKTVTRLSRKNVCFVLFMDEITLQTLSSEGQKPDRMGFIGLWKVVVVKNLPFTDMRRVGKIPKFLTHRLFPSARYSMWLDSKLRLQSDPLLIMEYFLWRKNYEYAISNHYDRHCVWEEVAQNKRLNKFNHTVIDEQFLFYQADGLKRFNSSDPNKLLPSNVPEGSFIVRAHTPMSNLFSCLWFNEVDRFTPRDQLSFAYVYHKLRRMNPGKPFHLNMFKDCERRAMAKLFRHRSEEKRYIPLRVIV